MKEVIQIIGKLLTAIDKLLYMYIEPFQEEIVIVEKLKSVQDFLILPDWIKVQLKINEKRYSSYPFMTDEEEQNRKEKIYKIASHFSKIPFNDLINNPTYTLDDTWPYILEKFITPKLLDLVSVNFWCKFGHCFFCAHWKGYKNIYFKLILKNKFKKIIPFSGNCRIQKRKDKRRVLISSSGDCCNVWLPDRLYQTLYIADIEKFLKKNNTYNYEDYVYDLHNINIWDYFFDKYTAKEEVY